MDAILNNNGVSLAMRLFHYVPEIIPAAVALAVYAVVAIYLTVRIYISKSPKFLYIFGKLFFVLCYIYLMDVLIVMIDVKWDARSFESTLIGNYRDLLQTYNESLQRY